MTLAAELVDAIASDPVALERLRQLGDRLDRIDVRLDRIETTVLRDHGERLEVQT